MPEFRPITTNLKRSPTMGDAGLKPEPGGVASTAPLFVDQGTKPVHGGLARADSLWTIATSYTALCFDAVVLLAALVVGYFPLLRYFPVIGPYVPVARLIAILAIGLLGFLVGFRVSGDREAIENRKSPIEA